MSTLFEDRVGRLARASDPDTLRGGLKGVEKESLRVDAEGYVAESSHPTALGSALTNRYITTDFSEALLEFVTPAEPETWQTLRCLCDIHQFVYDRIADELLWVTSMPCRLPGDRDIPLARYGDSNVGRMKTIYRSGLGYRYGRKMQTIAGVHFNYSLPEGFWPVYADLEQSSAGADAFRSASYLGLLRNFRRFGWLVLYLFGASPALCKSFADDLRSGLQELDSETLYAPFGTSLRMSDLGYSNKTQASIRISLNTLEGYIDDLSRAINTPEPAYEAFGVKVDDEYRQLSANQLQIENEYYSPIRPKRVAYSGERPTAALRRGGIEYVEIRSLDINAFDPVGINQNEMRFMEAFLVYCLLQESPLFDDDDWYEAAENQARTAKRGRDPALTLVRNGRDVRFGDWAREILADVEQVAGLIDRGDGGDGYAASVEAQRQLVEEPEATPSARIVRELRETGCSFFAFAMATAIGHKEYFASLEPIEAARLEALRQEASASLTRQREIEEADCISLDEYLARYFAA